MTERAECPGHAYDPDGYCVHCGRERPDWDWDDDDDDTEELEELEDDEHLGE